MSTRGDNGGESAALQKLLDQRTQLSGGTVDRHFTVSLQQQSAGNFALPRLEKLLSSPGGETLVFSLGGGQRDLVAVSLPKEGTPRQVVTQLNVGLGRLGIQAEDTSRAPRRIAGDKHQ